MVVSLFAVTVVTTAVLSLTMVPVYTAAAKIQIERQAPRVAPVQGVDTPELALGDKYDYYQTQFEVLESRTVAARVIRALGLESDERFTGANAKSIVALAKSWIRDLVGNLGSKESPRELGVDPERIDDYLDSLSIDPVRNSRLVAVSFTNRDPELAAAIANRHVEEFVGASLEQKLEVTGRAQEFLEGELAKAKDRLVAAEAALNVFRKDKGIVSLDGDATDIVSARLVDLNEKFTEVQADRIHLEGEYRLIEQRAYDSLPTVIGNPVVQRLREEIAKVSSKRALLEETFHPEYPELAEALARERELRANLDAEVRRNVESVRTAYLAARNREDELRRQLDTQRNAALSQKDVGAEYGTLKRDADTARELYASLLQRLKDMDVAAEIRMSNVSTVDRAAIPIRPSRPRILLNLVMASAFGLILGIGFAFFLEYLDDTLATPELVERKIGLPTLAVVPSFDRPSLAYGAGNRAGNGAGKRVPQQGAKPPAPVDGELVAWNDSRSLLTEAYRTMQTGILLSATDDPIKVIVFTSSLASEGKTVTAVNEALTLALSGGRVLLVDADIRKPRLHSIFQIANGHGLSTFLSGQMPLESMMHEVPLNGHARAGLAEDGVAGGRLFVVPAGPTPPNPAALLGSRRMRETLESLRGGFDFVLIDTPPVLPVTDTVRLAPMSDGVVLVVRGQETSHKAVAESRDRLLQARVRILGVVLNDVDLTSGDYYPYTRYYESYYATHPPADA